MKKSNLFFMLIMLFNIGIQGCPTCIGRMQADSPPFFSKKNNKIEVETSKYNRKTEQKVETPKSNKQSDEKKDEA
ncbi:MAG TPA: hypothetical protein PLU71_00925 [Candidatus Dependentiae bacterium]|nr:hypothetical protein [Candidatus Dependentiae bacterium]HRQ62397.1 hypothetical protein [Candidatus Dependentiae bacterium]